MDFTYTDDQKMLKEAARRYLAGACPNVEWYLEMEKEEKGFTPALWNGMAELGWMGILFPEEYGGIGGSVLDMVTLMEEMGYAVAIYPVITLQGAMEGAFRMCRGLSERGRPVELSDIPFGLEEINTLLGLDKYQQLEKKVCE